MIQSMEEPFSISSMPNPFSPSERTQETIEELHTIAPMVFREDKTDITKGKY